MLELEGDGEKKKNLKCYKLLKMCLSDLGCFYTVHLSQKIKNKHSVVLCSENPFFFIPSSVFQNVVCLFGVLRLIAYSPTFGTSNLDQCGHTCTDVDKKQMCIKSIKAKMTESSRSKLTFVQNVCKVTNKDGMNIEEHTCLFVVF